MNPTDQARKEARKKEIKRNKQQRKLVRDYVMKSKDPKDIFKEIHETTQKINHCREEYEKKPLKDKKTKLVESLDQLLALYEKEEPDRLARFKEWRDQFEKEASETLAYYPYLQGGPPPPPDFKNQHRPQQRRLSLVLVPWMRMMKKMTI